MTGIKVILFDVDGVLLDSGRANVVFYQAVFRRIGGVVPKPAELAAHNHRSMEATLRHYYPDCSVEQMRAWLALADSIDDGFELLRPMPGVLETLPILAKQYTFGLVTNRTEAGIEELWRVVPYRHLFPAFSAYEYTVKHKPDPEPIHYVLSKLGRQPTQAVFVGDAQTDLQAGQAAGVEVIILGDEQWPGVKANISSFHELPAALAQES